MRTRFLSFLVATILPATPGLAQGIPVYEETGTIEITLGGERMIHYTTRNTVPDDPTRKVDTASWLILEPRLMGGVNISPDDVFVVITSRDSIEPNPRQASMRVEISLDPETLDLKTRPAPSVRFYSEDDDRFYAMTDGTFTVESVTRIDSDSFTIIASASGVMTGQTSETIAHNPDDALEFSAKFDLQSVVNRAGESGGHRKPSFQ